MLELLGVSGITAYGVNKFVMGALDGAQTMQNLAQGTRLATDELQRYAAVTNILNPKISTEGAASAISDLDKRLNDWRLGLADGAPIGAAAGRAGISIGNMNAIQFLDALRQKFPGIDPTLQGGILRQAGLPPEFLNVLNATPETFKKIGDQVSLTSDDLKTLAESSRQLNKIFVEMFTFLDKELANLIRGGEKPTWKKLGDDFTSGIQKEWNDFIGKSSPANPADNSLTGIIGGARNNPGNVTRNGSIRSFSSLADGYNATADLLIKYQQKGWDTIDKIVEHWAPFKDQSGRVINPATGAGTYQSYLANLLKVGRNQQLDFSHNPALLKEFIKDQSQFEHGSQNGGARNNVTIYNHGEVKPETWAGYTLNSYQNAMYQQNNAAVA